jgi:NAD+ synthase
MTNDMGEIATIIKNFIATYLMNSRCKGIIIGLSGGVDSAVIAVLCQQAVGKSNMQCLFLPDETTPEVDRQHQRLLVDTFDLPCDTREIGPLVNAMTGHYPLPLSPLSLANVKARIRMTILFTHANMTNSLVCGASNKSELLVGYFTKYGDGGADIMPIGDVYKTEVLQLARYLNIPEEIITKPPTAGLLKDQTDEQDMNISYPVLDGILRGLEQKLDVQDIVIQTGASKQEVERIRNMRINSQHKRRSPLIPKIGLRTPGLDWRSPILLG